MRGGVGSGEVAKMQTWVHEDGAPARECLCWEAYHGDLSGSSGGVCIVERNAVGIRRGLARRYVEGKCGRHT